MKSYDFWVLRPKLLGVLVLMANEAGAYFDKQDYNAILYGLFKTDSDSNESFEYAFLSESNLTIGFTRDSDDGDIIFLRIESQDPAFMENVKLIDKFESCFAQWTLYNESHFTGI